MNIQKTDALDQRVHTTLEGSWLSMFLTELFQGISQLAMLLLLLEAIWDWQGMLRNPDIYVLFAMTLTQSSWLAKRQFKGQANPWWTRLIGLLCYALIESLIEGLRFFYQPKHMIFIVLTLIFVLGRELERQKDKPYRVTLGTVLTRTTQGLGPLLFYIAIDMRDQLWLEGFVDFLQTAEHTYLLALAIVQVGALISLSLIARRHRAVIVSLLDQLKTLSRWGFGSQVVEKVLRDRGTQAASRVERAIGFIDIRGFTAWSEAHQPEEVIGMLNRFYAAVLDSCGACLIKSKMSGDEVLLVLPADDQAQVTLQAALRAAVASVQPLHLSAGAGLWVGPVVEGFFGATEAQVHDVIGDTVNTAKRLCDHAQGGQLLAGPISALTGVIADQASIHAKGKTEPVQAAIFELS